MDTKLKIQDLRLHFGKKEVLKGINLNIKDNTITALIGPSGCGKSTLLRSINRMHDLDPSAKLSGSVFLDGENIYDRKKSVVDIRRKIGMVFQKPNPFPKSIYENVAYGLKINQLAKHKALQPRVEHALKSCYLWEEVQDQLGKSALELSGGQQQRLCIARAIAVEPEVLLMDEPCSALDPISTSKIEALMLRLKEQYCIVIVTHNMQQAQRVADYTAFMYLGELVEFGETAQIFNEPQMELTRNYVSGHFG
ncbi:MAG TPA: phosphate ABC transporter ATP-binding protein PstB [Saprospiraceae bacterium]|nr:phosphate ABC transporter ATP-binding protein PstB [Saprospiraceae bacterium]HMQ81774.1 phosphate ABC transporter ATP-binding protein PstB [Saprospiraceae bacterium]